mgnify:CR=1 FL=1
MSKYKPYKISKLFSSYSAELNNVHVNIATVNVEFFRLKRNIKRTFWKVERASYIFTAKLLPSTVIVNNTFGLNPRKDPCIIVFGLIEFNGAVTRALSTTILIFKPFHRPNNNWLLHGPNCRN